MYELKIYENAWKWKENSETPAKMVESIKLGENL